MRALEGLCFIASLVGLTLIAIYYAQPASRETSVLGFKLALFAGGATLVLRQLRIRGQASSHLRERR